MSELFSERDDWMEFRTLDTLARKAGVPKNQLARLIAKELADNGMDAGGQVTNGYLDGGGFFIEDDGKGIPGTAEDVAALFSVRRPLRSTKHVRLPTRGALGNGLRLVAGVILATGGTLVVKTQGHSLKLVPQEDGSTQVLSSEPWTGVGTRIEVYLGSGVLELGDELFDWVEYAVDLSGEGKEYKGSSSPWWYDPDSFWLLLQAHGTRPVRAVVEKLDGCSSRKASAVVGEQLLKRQAVSLSRAEAADLLERARVACKRVAPHRLGYVGRRADFAGYAKETGTFKRNGAEVPFVIEAWANSAKAPDIVVCVNRTPIVAEVRVFRHADDKTLYLFSGCNCPAFFKVHRKREFSFEVNIQCPFLPLTSDSKEPDCQPLFEEFLVALEKAARRASAKALDKGPERQFQQRVIVDAIPAAIKKVSGGGKHRYSQRQLFYAIRPVFIRAFGQEPLWGTFCKILTDHERALGKDLPGIYRDSRGTLYHPHLGTEIALGTLAVESYQRPDWTFNKILYCEKEGFFPILKDARWPERNDCALLTSKGFATRAVCDVLDLLGESAQPLKFFCIHDADGSGTKILEAMQDGARARPARQVEIINLGLEPDEAVAMGLEPETVKRKIRKDGELTRVAVATYLSREWRLWLQDQRVELNAMTTPEFLAWLDRKMAPHSTGKVIPPARVLQDTLTTNLRGVLQAFLTDKILREADLAGQVDGAVRQLGAVIKTRSTFMSKAVKQILETRPAEPWWVVVQEMAQEIAGNVMR